MVKCSVQSFIEQFDFKFNRVKYYCSRGAKYFANVDRIKKYISRGFIVTKCPDKERFDINDPYILD